MRFAPLFPGLMTTKSKRPEICHVGMLHACRIHGHFTALLPPDTPVGPKGGRPPVRNGVVLPVIWYVLSTGVRWHDILPVMGCSGRTALGGCNGGRKRRLGSVTYGNCWPFSTVTASWTWMSSSLTARWCPPPAAAATHGPQPDGPCQIRHQTHAAGGQAPTALPLALHTTGANRQRPTATGNHHSARFPHIQGKPGRPKEHPEAALADRGAMTAKPTACCCVGWESNRSSPSVAPNTVPVLASSDG